MASTTIANSQAPPLSPPFESIKSQLKTNEVPDAQLIQQHIDNLISRNEAIVDNWNLVSIRSYHTSQDYTSEAGISSASSALTTTTITTRSPTTKSAPTKCLDTCSNTNSSGDSIAIAASNGRNENPSHRKTKRWSTTSIASASSSLCGSSQHGISSNDSSLTPVIKLPDNPFGGDNRHQQLSSDNLGLDNVATRSKSKQVERKRSYNVPTRRYLHPFGDQASTLLAGPETIDYSFNATKLTNSIHGSACSLGSYNAYTSSANLDHGAAKSPAGSLWPLSPSLDSIRTYLSRSRTELGQQNHPIQPSPIHLESAIQNLSLERGESLIQRQMNSIYDRNNIEASSSCILDQYHLQQTEAQNLSLNCSGYPRDEQQDNMVIAALLLDRHRQSLMEQHLSNLSDHKCFSPSVSEANNVTGLMRPQQLANSFIDQQQYQKSQQNNHQMSIFASLAAAGIDSSNFPAYLPARNSINHANLDDYHLQSIISQDSVANYLQKRCLIENHLLKEPVSKILTNCETSALSSASVLLCPSSQLQHQEQQPLLIDQHLSSHEAEYLTQSLDSATPSHCCTFCDNRFWTAELLSYHQITQCPREASLKQAQRGSTSTKNEQQPISNTTNNVIGKSALSNLSESIDNSSEDPTSSNTSNDNELNPFRSSDQQNAEQNQDCCKNNALGTLPHQNTSKLIPVPRRRHTELVRPSLVSLGDDKVLVCDPETKASAEKLIALNRIQSVKDTQNVAAVMVASGPNKPSKSDSSILKQQLLTSSSPIVSHRHESLPFKKRKISDPNMKC